MDIVTLHLFPPLFQHPPLVHDLGGHKKRGRHDDTKLVGFMVLFQSDLLKGLPEKKSTCQNPDPLWKGEVNGNGVTGGHTTVS